MKIYILRHEDRTEDATFFSPLTEKGLNNANNLIFHLEKLGITKIYCSPYIRTMQTIYPFARKHNFKLNLDYNLIEIQHPTIIPPKSVNIELPSYIAKQFIFNENYISFMKASEIIYPEDINALELRTKKFIKNIITQYYKSDETILIVTHQGLCKVILSIINKFGKIKPDYKLIENYPLGTISLIFEDADWTYKKVN
jgi:2,3-bisphosphoglycerate-dependent phosphoglycerate mutase